MTPTHLAGIVLLCSAAAGCQIGQQRWIAATETIPRGTTQDEVNKRLGPPNQVMALRDFVARLDASPKQYHGEANGKAFGSYSDYILYLMSRYGDLDDSRGPDEDDGRWYEAPDLRDSLLWIYDESARYSKPYFWNWHCAIFAFRGGVMVHRFYPSEGWDPNGLGVADPPAGERHEGFAR